MNENENPKSNVSRNQGDYDFQGEYMRAIMLEDQLAGMELFRLNRPNLFKHPETQAKKAKKQK